MLLIIPSSYLQPKHSVTEATAVCIILCYQRKHQRRTRGACRPGTEVVIVIRWSRIMAPYWISCRIHFTEKRARHLFIYFSFFLDHLQEVMQPCKGFNCLFRCACSLENTRRALQLPLHTSHLTAICAMNLDSQNMHLLSDNLQALFLILSGPGTKSNCSLA